MDRRPLRIGIKSAYAIDNVVGGEQENVRYHRKHLAERGHKVTVFAPQNPNHPKSVDGTVHVGVAKEYVTNGTSNLSCRSLLPPSFLYGLQRRYNLDVGHYHEPEINLPWIQDLMYSESTNVLTFHANNPAKFNLKFWLVAQTRHLVGGKIHGKTLVSDAQRPFQRRYYPGEFRTIPNGVDTERFNPGVPKIRQFMDGKVNVLYVGRLEERKNVDSLIAAYGQVRAQVENTRLIIVGNGPMDGELTKKAASIPDVWFRRDVSAEELPSYYATADIFTSPPMEKESFGIVLLEAWASGKPAVVGDNDGHRSVVTGEEAIIVNTRDTQQYAGTLLSLINSKEERQRRGEFGLAKAQDYAWPKVVVQTEEYYYELLEQRKAKSSRK